MRHCRGAMLTPPSEQTERDRKSIIRMTSSRTPEPRVHKEDDSFCKSRSNGRKIPRHTRHTKAS
jgi:hypothetical protein